MYVSKLFRLGDTEELLFTATEPTSLFALAVSSNLSTDRLGAVFKKVDATYSQIATFTMAQGPFQRSLMALLPVGFQLAAGESLVLRATPDLTGEDEWVGLSGYAYPVQAGGIPSGLTQQVAEILPAIEAVRDRVPVDPANQLNQIDSRVTTLVNQTGLITAILDSIRAAQFDEIDLAFQSIQQAMPVDVGTKLDAIKDAIANLQLGAGGGSSVSPQSLLQQAISKYIDKSDKFYLARTSDFLFTWNCEAGDTGYLYLGPFTAGQSISFLISGSMLTANEAMALTIEDYNTSATLMARTALKTWLPLNPTGYVSITVPTGTIPPGTQIQLKFEDASTGQFLRISAFFIIN